jgi:hypothetical protein
LFFHSHSVQIDINTPSFFAQTIGLDLNFQHFIAAVAVNGFLILVCLGILQDRFRRRRRLLALIPRRQMPIVHMGDLSKRHLGLVLDRIVHNAHTRVDPPLGASNAAFESVRDPALFASSVRHSIDTIRKAADGLVPASAANAASVEYMAALRRAVPALTLAMCDAYVDVYDDATDPDAEPITQQQYDDFVTNFFDILGLIEPYASPTTAAPHAPLRKTTSAATATAAATAAAATAPAPKSRRRAKAKGKRAKNDAAADPDDGVELRPTVKSNK